MVSKESWLGRLPANFPAKKIKDMFVRNRILAKTKLAIAVLAEYNKQCERKGERHPYRNF